MILKRFTAALLLVLFSSPLFVHAQILSLPTAFDLKNIENAVAFVGKTIDLPKTLYREVLPNAKGTASQKFMANISTGVANARGAAETLAKKIDYWRSTGESLNAKAVAAVAVTPKIEIVSVDKIAAVVVSLAEETQRLNATVTLPNVGQVENKIYVRHASNFLSTAREIIKRVDDPLAIGTHNEQAALTLPSAKTVIEKLKLLTQSNPTEPKVIPTPMLTPTALQPVSVIDSAARGRIASLEATFGNLRETISRQSGSTANSFALDIKSSLTNLSSVTGAFSSTVSIGDILTLNGATTTAASGFNIASGCFAVNGVCITPSAGGGGIAAGNSKFATSTNGFALSPNGGSSMALVLGGSATTTTGPLLEVLGQFYTNGSSTLQNFTFKNATGTSATTTNFFATTASSTNLFGTLINGFGLASCTGTNALTWAGGSFTCTAQPQGTVTSVTATWPVISSGGATPVLSWGGLATTSNPTAGNLFYSNGTNGLIPVATSSPTFNGGLTTSGTAGYLVGGSAYTISLANISANSILANITGVSAAPVSLATSSLFVWQGTGNVVRDTSPTIATPTFTTSLTGPTHIGGTAVSSSLSLQSTSGAGTSDFINFLLGSSGATEAGRFNTLGNLGLGTTTPQWKLQIASSTGPQLTLSDPSILTNNHWSFRNAGGYLYLATSSPTTFATSTVTSLTIDLNGNFGFGTSTPNNIFSVGRRNASIATDRKAIEINAGGFAAPAAYQTASNGDKLILYRDSTGNYDATIGVGTTADMWFKSSGTSGNGQFKWYTGNGVSQTLTLDPNGNLGIGQGSPGSKLSVSGAATIGASYDTTVAPANGLIIQGNVGIGTTTAINILSVGARNAGTGSDRKAIEINAGGFASPGAYQANSDGDKLILYRDSTGNYDATIGVGTTANMWFKSSGTSGNGRFEWYTGNSVNQVMTLSATGNLGLGTTTPQWLLQLATSTAPQLTISDNGSLTNNHWSFRNAGGLLYLATSSPTTFATSSATALTIDLNGNIGIGTTTPTAKFEIVSTVSALTSNSLFLSNLDSATNTATRLSFRALDKTGLATTTASIVGLLGKNFIQGTSTLIFSTLNAGSLSEILRLTDTGLQLVGSTTLQNFTAVNSTSSQATSTSFFSTNLFGTTGFLTNLLMNGSSTLQNFTFVNATGTSATTTNFFATTASSTNLFAAAATIGNNLSFTNNATTTISTGTTGTNWVIATTTNTLAIPIIAFSANGATSTISLFGATTTGIAAGVGVGLPSQLKNELIVGNGKDQASIAVVNGSLCLDNDGWCTASTTAGRLTALGEQITASDLAEAYNSSESLEAGDMVSSSGGLSVTLSTQANRSRMMGVVSTDPGIVLGLTTDESISTPGKFPIALSGRIPAKVNNEYGDIKAGDYLTLSSTPGVAAKALKAGVVIGQALADYSGNGIGKIMIFVKNSYYSGIAADKLAGLTPEGALPDAKQILASLMNGSLTTAGYVSDITADRLTAAVEIITPKLTADSIFANKIESPTIDALTARILALESASATPPSSGNILQGVTDWIGNKITAALGVFTRIEVGTAHVSQGLELIDQGNGSTYCLTIKNGEWDKVQGVCGSAPPAIVTPPPAPPPETIASSTPPESVPAPDAPPAEVASSTPVAP